MFLFLNKKVFLFAMKFDEYFERKGKYNQQL